MKFKKYKIVFNKTLKIFYIVSASGKVFTNVYGTFKDFETSTLAGGPFRHVTNKYIYYYNISSTKVRSEPFVQCTLTINKVVNNVGNTINRKDYSVDFTVALGSLEVINDKIVKIRNDLFYKIEKGDEVSMTGLIDVSMTGLIDAVKHNGPTNSVGLKDVKKPLDDSLDGRYGRICGTISSISKDINDNTKINSASEIEALFKTAKENLENYANIRDEEPKSFFFRLFNGSKEKRLNTVTDRIDELFKIIEQRYEALITTGEKFDSIQKTLNTQIEELEKLAQDSDKELTKYNQDDIPIRAIGLNSQIKASLESAKAKALQVSAGLLITRGAVASLGSRLPQMKTNINDEMAFASLLAEVSNVHGMIGQTAELMISLSKSTSAATFDKVKELMQEQINDNTQVRYLQNQQEASNNLCEMLNEQAQQLVQKTLNESQTVQSLSLSNTRATTAKLENLSSSTVIPTEPISIEFIEQPLSEPKQKKSRGRPKNQGLR